MSGYGQEKNLEGERKVREFYFVREKSRGGGGELVYDRGGDARLAQGCKFRILVSLKVFWAKRQYIQL